MIHPNLFDGAQNINTRILNINKTYSQGKYFIDISVMPEYVNGHEGVLEYLQVEQRDKDGKLLAIVSNYLTDTEVDAFLDGYETAREMPLMLMAQKSEILTVDDLKHLIVLGNAVTDLPQIIDCAKECKYYINEKHASYAIVLKCISREEWLSGLSRVAFHQSTTRYGIRFVYKF